MVTRAARRWGTAPRARRPLRSIDRRAASGPAALDPVASARAAGLRYVSDTAPGIQRKRSGDGWTYLDPEGRVIHDRATLDRIRRLAIPPAYIDVWISPDPLGHIQATGRDARGRKQYRYHPRYRETRDETKFGRMPAFGEALPRIRARVDADLGRRGLPRQRVLAATVRLLESTGIRIGNEEYARVNHHFGLTTLREEHVAIEGATLRFQFVGKEGKLCRCHVTDRRLAKIVQRCQSLPGEELFKYIDDTGQLRTIGSGDVNAYVREISGEHFTAKDFRTWAGTMLAADVLRKVDVPTTQRGIKSAISRAIDWVAQQLNNTRTVCRKYYVHPAVLDAFASGRLRDTVKSSRGPKHGAHGLDPLEVEVVSLLRRRATDRVGAPEGGNNT
jgi:DNA topoisomerase-1